MIISLLSVGIIRCGAYILYEFPAILYASKLYVYQADNL